MRSFKTSCVVLCQNKVCHTASFLYILVYVKKKKSNTDINSGFVILQCNEFDSSKNSKLNIGLFCPVNVIKHLSAATVKQYFSIYINCLYNTITQIFSYTYQAS